MQRRELTFRVFVSSRFSGLVAEERIGVRSCNPAFPRYTRRPVQTPPHRARWRAVLRNVTSRGDRREAIDCEAQDRLEWLAVLGEVRRLEMGGGSKANLPTPPENA